MFRRGQVQRMVFSKSHYARAAALARGPLWRYTLSPIGYALGYLAWPLVQVAWFLMFGAWAHVTTGTHEYVPEVDRRARWVPPLIFRGKVQRVHVDDQV